MSVLAVGSQVRFRGSFSNLTGVLTDPTTITLKVRPPGGAQTAYTFAAAQLIKESTGIYRMDLAINTGGVWTYRWEGAGTLIASTPDREFTVFGTSFT